MYLLEGKLQNSTIYIVVMTAQGSLLYCILYGRPVEANTILTSVASILPAVSVICVHRE